MRCVAATPASRLHFLLHGAPACETRRPSGLWGKRHAQCTRHDGAQDAASCKSQCIGAKDRVDGSGIAGAPCRDGAAIVQTRSAMKHPSAAINGLGDHDIYLFREGTHSRLHRKLGCHLGADGAHFAVWAPNAAAVSVIGDFNGWRRDAHPLAAARGRLAASGRPTSPAVAARPALQVPHRARATARCSTRPTRSRSTPSCRRPPRRAPGRSTTSGTTPTGWRERARAQRARRADVDLRGAPRLLAPRRRRPACSATARRRDALADYVVAASASRTSS